jgi:hypothetical protein
VIEVGDRRVARRVGKGGRISLATFSYHVGRWLAGETVDVVVTTDGFQCIRRCADPCDEDGEVGAEIPVGDHGDIELSGVRKRADSEGHVAGDGDYWEHFEKSGPRKVQRYRRSWNVRDVEVCHPLTLEVAQKSLLSELRVEHEADGFAAFLFPIVGFRCDEFEPANVVCFPDGKMNSHSGAVVALPGTSLVERHGNHCSEDQVVDLFAAAQKQFPQTTGDPCQKHVVHLGVVGVGDVFVFVQGPANDAQLAVQSNQTVETCPGSPLFREEFAERRPESSSPSTSNNRMGQKT